MYADRTRRRDGRFDAETPQVRRGQAAARATGHPAALIAVDSVGAGVHEKVLIVIEGRAAGEALGKKAAPVDAAVIGIIDEIDLQE
jgi:microcompartment protein CcmK/EutM